ncbi:hypothetical protein B0I35DRAFT_437585 [Stachybotrys elegans]|uniref:AAA+ ATPase domain-containing protein n=1 Tax=Stachybotrys elegans TaxID=80388 RepID=A0A8K0WPZ9_9HYPO|nr:hypothetical protein B0I35DRAFT_437585 [Stachybotrys elegans]
MAPELPQNESIGVRPDTTGASPKVPQPIQDGKPLDGAVDGSAGLRQTEEDVSVLENKNVQPAESEHEEDFSEGESDADVAIIGLRSSSTSRELLAREKRHRRLALRSKQAIIHQHLTIVRIEELEAQVLELKALFEENKDSLDDLTSRRDMFPVHLHELRRCTMDGFRLSREVVLLPTKQQPAVEVLLAPWSIPPTSMQGSEAENSMVKCVYPPERLRIRSHPLLYHLEVLTGARLLNLSANNLEGERVHNARLFLPPFKMFVRHEVAIRQSLKDKLDGQKPAASEGTSEVVLKGSLPQPNIRFNQADLLKDLKLLVDFIDVDLRPTLDLRRRIKDGTVTEITYPDLWHLFERGDIVVGPSPQLHAFLVFNTAGGRDRFGDRYIPDPQRQAADVSLSGFVVDYVSIGYNGVSYVPRLNKVLIKKFHGPKQITSLPVYPLRCHPKAADLEKRFSRNGDEFLKVTREPFCHRVVRGRTLDEPPHELDEQVIIDMALAMDANPDWRLESVITQDKLTQGDPKETGSELWCEHSTYYAPSCCGSDITVNDLETDTKDSEKFLRQMNGIMGPMSSEDISDDLKVIIRPFVHAFVLRSRRWVTISVEDLQAVSFQNSFRDLVLPEKNKITVQALVQTHQSATSASGSVPIKNSSIGASLDIVRGKGRGLIILLHGPPGVGKTSTAECVADDTKKPLFPITCGDLGETAIEVEDNLQHIFRLAHKWGCVLLLDEADIFLAKRTKTDLRHNAVTSVFLRSLEYYAGILFLTTNRVGAIDPAFRSRIQLSVSYEPLNLEVTCKLYEKFIKRAKDEQERTNTYNFKIKEKEILKFGRRHFKTLAKEGYDTWNGRQIRNAFQTAIALAEHANITKGEDDPKPVLGKEQFEVVADGFREFDNYLIVTLGLPDSEIANREGVRADGFSKPGAKASRPAVNVAQATTERHAGAPASWGAGNDTDSDSDSETDSDDESSESDKEKRTKKGKKADSSSKKSSGSKKDEEDDEEEDFKQFLKWKKMQK